MHNLFGLVKFGWLANIKPKRIASASRGLLAAARLSCSLRMFLNRTVVSASNDVRLIVAYYQSHNIIRLLSLHQR